MKNNSTPIHILKPSKISTITLGCVSVLFVAGGIFLILEQKLLIGSLCAGFFGIGVIIAFLQLLPGASQLAIFHDRLEVTSLFRTSVEYFDHIHEFAVLQQKANGLTTHKMVGYTYVNTFEKSSVARKIAHALSGLEGALPDTYGMKAEELAILLTEYVNQYRKEQVSHQ